MSDAIWFAAEEWDFVHFRVAGSALFRFQHLGKREVDQKVRVRLYKHFFQKVHLVNLYLDEIPDVRSGCLCFSSVHFSNGVSSETQQNPQGESTKTSPKTLLRTL